MIEESEGQVFLSAKRTAARYGCATGNFSQFLNRLAAKHPIFPKPVWLGSRKFFRISEIESFERDLPRERVKQDAA